MTLHYRYRTWPGTLRQPPRERGIVEFVDDAGVVRGWAWTFSDAANLIERDDVEMERRLRAVGKGKGE